MSTLSPAETRQIEDEYAEQRGEIIDFVSRSFSWRVADAEEVYQDAWAELLELRARGTHVEDSRKALRAIAWRRARDRVRNNHADPFDPTSRFFRAREEPAPTPEEQAQIKLDAATARQIVATLSPRQAAVIKLRFEAEMDGREIQAELGVNRKRYEKIVTEAWHCVEALLVTIDGGETVFRRRQRSLLLACLLGTATTEQLERARQMVAEDVGCRAMLRHLRHTLDRVAVLTPGPILVDRRPNPIVAAFDRVIAVFERVKQFFEGLLPRGAARVPSEQVAAGGAATLGAGAAAKVALTCIAVGATAVCIDAVRPSSPDKPKSAVVTHHRTAMQSRHRSHPKPVPLAPAPPQLHHVVVAAPVVVHHHATHHLTKSMQTAPHSAAAPAQPSPAPVGSTEFGPGSVGSHAAPATPASAPSGGGGEFLP